MPKALCIAGGVVAALLLLVFGTDLLSGFPFDRALPSSGKWFPASFCTDIGMIICSGILGYVSWSTLRQLQ